MLNRANARRKKRETAALYETGQCSQCGRPDVLVRPHPTDKGDSYGRYCPACVAMLRRPLTVVGANGKPCPQTTGVCSCCGDDFGPEGHDGWYLFKAGWLDEDGEPMSRLCGRLDGATGCIYKVRPMGGRAGQMAAVLREVLGDDLDGFQAEAEDLRIRAGAGLTTPR